MKKVLLVGNSEVVQTALAASGYELTACNKAEEALELLRADLSAFDIMVVDSRLADMDGLTFCKELRELRIPVLKILLLESGDEATADEALLTGINDFIIKDAAGDYASLVPVVLKKVLLACDNCISIKHLENLIKESEEKFQKAFMSSPNPISISAASDGRILEINDKAVSALGYSRDGTIGKTSVEIGIVTAQDRDVLKEILLEHGHVENLEMNVRTKGGDIRTALLSGCTISLRGQECFILTINDITQRKQMENELRKARTLDSIGNLAGGIARDFNDFLTSIMGNISIAMMSMHDVNKIHKSLGRAEAIAIKAADLATKLLTFSDGGSPIYRECSLAGIIRDVTIHRFKGDDAKIVYSKPQGLWPVKGDESQLQQLLYSIFLNAAEAMPEGGDIVVTTENTGVSADNSQSLAAGDYVKVTVKDTGSGIPAEDLDKIFDPFFSTKDTITRTGAGLGLSICRSIVTKHSGYIGVASTLGKGTEVEVFIPAANSE